MTTLFDDIERIALARPEPSAEHLPDGVPSDEFGRIQKWRASNKAVFAAAAKNDAVELSIIGVIGGGWFGDGISARSVERFLSENKSAKEIRVLVDSPGGDYFDGVAIMNQLKRHAASVTVEVIGEASSAGSVVAMGGDDIEMHTGTVMMIHRAWTIGMGNGDDFRVTAQQLDKIDDSLGSVYEARTSKPRAEIDKLVAATTYMTAKEAVADGFADREVAAKTKKPAAGGAGARALNLGAPPAQPALSAASEPITPAPEDRKPSPANLGEEQTEMALPKFIITALALTEDADENAAVAAVNKLKVSASVGGQIEQLLGVAGPAALGTVRALQEERETNKGLGAEVSKLKIVNARRELDALIERGKNVTKNLTAFGVKDYTQQFENAAKLAEGENADADKAAERCNDVCASLKGYLAIAPRFASDARQPLGDGSGGEGDAPITHNGKKFEELKPMDQKRLKDANPDLYNTMREDAQARGAI